MPEHLVVEVYLHDGRFHGRGEWPPSPARLFQALVAGAAHPDIGVRDRTALEWLESLAAPIIACPKAGNGQRFSTFVPNNDLDAVAGDVGRVSEIRTNKTIEPKLLEPGISFRYVWNLEGSSDDNDHLAVITAMADKLYQFGRGVDMAYASACVVGDDELQQMLSMYSGRIHVPSVAGGDLLLRTPSRGTMRSLEIRHAAQQSRVQSHGAGRKRRETFSQPPKPHFRQVSYDNAPSLNWYELQQLDQIGKFYPWPQRLTVQLVETIRDAVVKRLVDVLPATRSDIENVLIGRRADGTNGYPSALRVQIIPLPSVGHAYVGAGIRRVCVKVPPGSALTSADIDWAFSNLEITGPQTAQNKVILIKGQPGSNSMMRNYGMTSAIGCVWRTATPVAVPAEAARRRIDPAHRDEQAKRGSERAAEEERAVAAVRHALRHADVRADCTIQVQREPFGGRGARAESFAEGTRFAKERLWHVQLIFDRPRQGPVVIGDGRFVGLGVMHLHLQPVIAFSISSGLTDSDPSGPPAAFRRAIMSRVQRVVGPSQKLSTFFSGHKPDGSPSEGHGHLAFSYEPQRQLLLIVPPMLPTRNMDDEFRILEEALDGFEELKAGRSGVLSLQRVIPDQSSDPLLRPSRSWVSVTPFQVTRHRRGVTPADMLAENVLTECDSWKMPKPTVSVLRVSNVAGRPISGYVRMVFSVPVAGPIMLGRNRHLGGGLFADSTP